jgi:arylsulfatase A-like enzyme
LARAPLPIPKIALALAVACAACTASRRPVDLIAQKETLLEARAGDKGRDWLLPQAGKQIRLDDHVLRTLPAGPASLYRFPLDVPARARLALFYAVAPEYYEQPGVEFVVRARRGNREATLWTSLLDPLGHPQHRGWQRAEVDLAAWAGRGVELLLETRGFEENADPRRAFWGAPAVTAEARDSPLVIVYLVDTLRADHTTPYGYERNTTPELAAFARDAVVFDTAIAQASWTKPSVASLFTSLLPGRHMTVQLRDPLDPGLVTLAEMLSSRGYATGAAIANSVIYGAGNGFEQGFDDFAGLHDDTGRASKEVRAGAVVEAALRFLDSRRGLPAFLYVHTMDPHVPYTPPPPFDMRYEPHPEPGHPGVDPRTDYSEPADRERLMAQYDGEIAYGDQEFGRFVRELRARGLYDRALVLFLGDHGEEFFDHGGWLHGRSVFDELVRVPLIAKFPGSRGAGKRVAQQVQVVDVLPSVLEELRLPVPSSPAIAGHPLQPVIAGGAPEPPAVSEISHRGFVASGMRTHRYKYIQRFSPQEDELFFDLARDPKEHESRLDQDRERLRLLKAGVEAAMVPDPFRRHLRARGGGVYELRLRTPGWIEGAEPLGLGAGELLLVEEGGRRLQLRLRPRPGQPREVAFSVRPFGAPIWLEGTRDGHLLRPQDVLLAENGLPPEHFPVRLPEVELDTERLGNVLAPPRADAPGLHIWLMPLPGRRVLEFDAETREKLKALGYLGPG